MTETKKPYHHGDLRRTLIDTALDMLDEDAGWQFTLREVARRAGVSHAAPYKHFPDKAALLAELAKHGFAMLRQAIVAARPESSPSQRVTFLAMSRAYVEFGASKPSLYSLIFSADARLAQSVEMDAEGEAALNVLVDLFREGQATGWLKMGAVHTQAVACWAQLHGLTLLRINGLLKPYGEATISDEALAILLEGLEA